jgi:hypothetical protein
MHPIVLLAAPKPFSFDILLGIRSQASHGGGQLDEGSGDLFYVDKFIDLGNRTLSVEP